MRYNRIIKRKDNTMTNTTNEPGEVTNFGLLVQVARVLEEVTRAEKVRGKVSVKVVTTDGPRGYRDPVLVVYCATMDDACVVEAELTGGNVDCLAPDRLEGHAVVVVRF